MRLRAKMSSHIVDWTPEMEINLFYAMIDHKPVGENKHFHMMFIYEKFNNLSEKKLSVEQLWDHLANLYDLQALVNNIKHSISSHHIPKSN